MPAKNLHKSFLFLCFCSMLTSALLQTDFAHAKDKTKKSVPAITSAINDKNFLKNIGDGINENPTLNMKVVVKFGGKTQKLASYRYKFGLSDQTDCALNKSYSKWTSVSKKLLISTESFSDQPLVLCLLGKSGKLAQKPAKATVYKWARQLKINSVPTTEPTPAATIVPTPEVTATPSSTPTPIEVVLKDHVSDKSCWQSTNGVFSHFNSPSELDSIAAAAFIGQGGMLKRVGGIFVDSNCSVFNSGSIENMQTFVVFYENKDVFLADPYLKNQPQGSASRIYPVTKLHTDPSDPQYFLNPIATTLKGTQQYYIEADVSQYDIRTTAGQEHLAALWFASESNDDGVVWGVFSGGCAGQVGSNIDYYKSDNDHRPAAAAKFSEIGKALQDYAAFFVSEEDR